MSNSRRPLGLKTQNKNNIKTKRKPQWDDSINDVGSMKLNRSEMEKRTKLYSAQHMEKIRNEIRAVQRQDKKVKEAVHSSPFTSHNQSIIHSSNSPDAKTKLQELLNETDKKMSEARDLFGDNGYKYRVIPNMTSAPSFKHSPVTMVRTTRDSPPPPTALNDTQKLGVVTVEKLPPDNSVINLARIRLLLDEEKENLRTAQNTLLNSHLTSSVVSTGKVNKVLYFNEEIPTLNMEERTTRPVSLQNGSLKKDKNRKGTKQGNHQMKKGAQKVVENGENTVDKTGKLNHAPQTNGDMELAIGKVARVTTLTDRKETSLDTSLQPLESSNESLVSPSRIKKQQQLDKKKKISSSGCGLDLKEVSGDLSPPCDEDSIQMADEDPAVNSPRTAVTTVNVNNGSSSESGVLVHTATSPFFPLPTEKRESATSPARTENASPVRNQIKDFEGSSFLERKGVNAPLPITRGTNDRPYTDEELKERLEELIVGGSYPFAKVEQKSYAIPENVEEKPVVWVQEQTETTDEQNMKFIDSSPLKGAAIELELKLRKYQKQIGTLSAKKTDMAGFTGYTALLLQSVSTMIGYLTEQECNTNSEKTMRSEIIETMGALQVTVETLSSELLSCRKDLSATKQKVQTLEHEYSSTLSFLVDNCVLKDPTLPTPKVAKRSKPVHVSPFTAASPAQVSTSKSPTTSSNSDLINFTPKITSPLNLMTFTPSRPLQDSDQTLPSQLIHISPEALPETSEQYLQQLEMKAEALRTDLDAKINKVMADKVAVEKNDRISADNSDLSLLSSRFGNFSDLNISSLTDDGLDLSQDLDCLIERLKQMNEQTLAVSSQTLGLTPKKHDVDTNESLVNIKNILDIDNQQTEAATEILEAYNRESSFSPSQLLEGENESCVFNGINESSTAGEQNVPKAVSEVEITSHHNSTSSSEITPILISPLLDGRGSGAQFPRRISGEFIGGYTGVNDSCHQRPVSPNPLSPKRLTEEIRRCTPCIESDEETLSNSVSTTPNSSHGLADRLDISTPVSKLDLSLNSTTNPQSPASSPSQQVHSPKSSTGGDSPPDKAALINQFLAENPHYLKKISESLCSASLPAFPTSPALVPVRKETQDDIKADSKLNPPIGSSGGVSKGSVTENIAKFERRRQEVEAELERERSISPKRSPKRSPKQSPKGEKKEASRQRSPGSPRKGNSGSTRRKPSPNRKVKNRVSWDDDQINKADQTAKPCTPQDTLLLNSSEPQHPEEAVMKPNRQNMQHKRNAPKIATQMEIPVISPEEISEDFQGNKCADDSLESGGDLMAQLLTLNDAKLTELVTTLNQLTER